MIPAAGLAVTGAAEEVLSDASVELLDVLSPADNFSQGKVTRIQFSNNEIVTPNEDGTFEVPYQLNPEVGLKISYMDVQAFDGTVIPYQDYTITITDAEGGVISNTDGIFQRGTYTITVTATDKSAYAGGEISGTTLELVGQKLSDVLTLTTISGSDYATSYFNAATKTLSTATDADAKDFTYNGQAQQIGVYTTDGKLLVEGQDYTVTYYQSGHEVSQNEVMNATVDAAGQALAVNGVAVSPYYALLTGIGNYSGTVKTTEFDVDPLDLKSTTLTFGDGGYVVGATTELPEHPSAIKIGNKTYTNTNLTDQINVVKWSSNSQSATDFGTYTTLLQVAQVGGKTNTNIIDTAAKYGATATTPADDAGNTSAPDATHQYLVDSTKGTVIRVAKNATVLYNGAAIENGSVQTINTGNKEGWSNTTITIQTPDGKILPTTAYNSTGALNLASTAAQYTYVFVDKDGTTYTNFDALPYGTYTVKVSAVDMPDNTKDANSYAAYAEFTLNYIAGVIDCATNATLYQVNSQGQYVQIGKNVDQVETVYNGQQLVKNIIVVNNDKTPSQLYNMMDPAKGSDSATFSVQYKDADGNVVPTPVNAGTYTLTINSTKYQLTNNTITIVIAPQTLTDLKLVNASTQLDGTKGLQLSQLYVAATDSIPAQYNSILNYVNYKLNTAPTTWAAWGPNTICQGNGNFKIIVTDASGKEIKPNAITTTGTYTLTPAMLNPNNGNYEVTAAPLTVNVFTQQKFLDVRNGDWCFDYVNKAADLGYIHGYSDGKFFGPSNPIIRGDVAMIIWNMAGNPAVGPDFGDDNERGFVTGFSDCDSTEAQRGMYYNQAIAWCHANNIVTGYGGTTEFGPQNNITRQEFATMLTRYATLKGKNTTVENAAAVNVEAFKDASDIAAYAQNAVAYLYQQGIMTGYGDTGYDYPNLNVTRAEVAKMAVVEQPTKIGFIPGTGNWTPSTPEVIPNVPTFSAPAGGGVNITPSNPNAAGVPQNLAFVLGDTTIDQNVNASGDDSVTQPMKIDNGKVFANENNAANVAAGLQALAAGDQTTGTPDEANDGVTLTLTPNNITKGNTITGTFYKTSYNTYEIVFDIPADVEFAADNYVEYELYLVPEGSSNYVTLTCQSTFPVTGDVAAQTSAVASDGTYTGDIASISSGAVSVPNLSVAALAKSAATVTVALKEGVSFDAASLESVSGEFDGWVTAPTISGNVATIPMQDIAAAVQKGNKSVGSNPAVQYKFTVNAINVYGKTQAYTFTGLIYAGVPAIEDFAAGSSSNGITATNGDDLQAPTVTNTVAATNPAANAQIAITNYVAASGSIEFDTADDVNVTMAGATVVAGEPTGGKITWTVSNIPASGSLVLTNTTIGGSTIYDVTATAPAATAYIDAVPGQDSTNGLKDAANTLVTPVLDSTKKTITVPPSKIADGNTLTLTVPEGVTAELSTATAQSLALLDTGSEVPAAPKTIQIAGNSTSGITAQVAVAKSETAAQTDEATTTTLTITFKVVGDYKVAEDTPITFNLAITSVYGSTEVYAVNMTLLATPAPQAPAQEEDE